MTRFALFNRRRLACGSLDPADMHLTHLTNCRFGRRMTIRRPVRRPNWVNRQPRFSLGSHLFGFSIVAASKAELGRHLVRINSLYRRLLDPINPLSDLCPSYLSLTLLTAVFGGSFLSVCRSVGILQLL